MKHQLITTLILPAMLASTAAIADNIPDGSPVAPAGSTKSIFISDPFEAGFGKDPFYPRTERFLKKKVEVEDDHVLRVKFPELFLRGVSSADGRKLAIINTYTMAEGEESSFKGADGKAVKVKCVLIKDKSVIVSALGETKEITLRAAVQ